MIKILIAGIVWPAVATGVILAVGAILRRRARDAPQPIVDPTRPPGRFDHFDNAVSAVAVAFGYCAGHIAVLGRPSFPPVSAEHWLIPIAFGAGALAVIERIHRLPPAARWIVRAAALGAFLTIPLGPMWRYFAETQAWSRAATAGWIAAFAAMFVAGWVSLAVSAQRSAGWAVAVPLGVAIAGLGGVLGLSGSASLGQLAGSLAVSLGVLALVGAIGSGDRPIGGAVLVCWFVMIALLCNGFTFGEVAPLPAALIVLAPFSTLLGRSASASRPRRWVGGVVATSISLLLTAAAVFFAYREYASLEELPY